MRLPGTEEWNSDAVSLRIAFERNVATASVPLLTEIAAGRNFYNPEELGQRLPSDSIFALGRAAELAFCTENFDLGFQILREMLIHDYTAPRTPLQFAFYATVGALLRSFKIMLYPYGAVIVEPPDTLHEKFKAQLAPRMDRIEWPMSSSTVTVKLIRLLLPAAAASGLSSESVDALSGNIEEQAIKPSIAAAVLASQEYEAIAAWRAPQVDFDWLTGAIESLETNYHRQLRLLRSDAFYWRTLRPKGSIIDWSLLALWVFILRRGGEHDVLERIHASSDEATYIRSLASIIETHTFDIGHGDWP